MHTTRRRMIKTLLIVSALLAGLPRAAVPQTREQTMEALQLQQRVMLLYDAGNYDEVIRLSERAIELQGGRSTEVGGRYGLASPLSYIAKAYHAKGDYQRAEAYFRRLITQMESDTSWRSGEQTFAAAYNELATVYEAMGDNARALQSRVRGNELIEQHLLRLLAPSVKTAPAADSWAELRNRAALEVARLSGASSAKDFIVDDVNTETDAAVSLSVQRLPRDGRAAELALTTILQRKGRILDASADQLNVLRRYGNAQDQVLIERLSKAHARLAAYANGDGQKMFVPDVRNPSDQAKLVEMAERAARQAVANIGTLNEVDAELSYLEGEVGRRSAELRAPMQPVTLSAVRQAVPADAALVEIFVYRPFDPKAKLEAGPPGRARAWESDRLMRGGQNPAAAGDATPGVRRYVAYVVRHADEMPQWVELGDAAEIDEAVERLREALRDPRRADVREQARALDARVMQPVRKLLGATRRVLIAPDGALNLIPFAALVDEKNQYLVENYSISYLTSGRDLLRLNGEGESRDAPKIFADPLFDAATAGGAAQAGGSPVAPSARQGAPLHISVDLKSLNYAPLPGTAAEAAAIGQLLPGAVVLTRERATEEALKRVKRPRLLHVATHGFFLTTQADGETPGKSPWSVELDAGMNTSARGHNQLLRSGLILAGVRQKASGADEDGVLTALEMAGMDLWGTRLVVLSACETGLGDVMIGEGVYGLRRALLLAGSQTQVMSLWKVSDAGTRDLMVAYYTLLQQDVGRTEAMRQVQLAMLRDKLLPAARGGTDGQKGKRDTAELAGEPAGRDYRHPYYWAAFIPSGDWRSMDGK